MSLVYFDGTITESGAVLTSADGIADGDTVILAESGTLVSQDLDGINLDYIGVDLGIYGSIYAHGTAVHVDNNAPGVVMTHSIVFGENATINAGLYALYSGYQQLSLAVGSRVDVENAGELTSRDSTAVFLFGTENIVFNNSGSVRSLDTDSSYSQAVTFYLAKNISLNNSGTITNVATTMPEFVNGIENVATISMNFGNENSVMVNSGVISSAQWAYYSLSSVSESFTNTGDIFGSMFMSDNSAVSSKLINNGLIDGDVLMNDGDDNYNGLQTGIVTGIVDGGLGDDTLRGSSANDLFEGGDGLDYLRGRQGDDDLYGGASADVIRGNDGDDFIQGDQGADTLYGGRGDDAVLGGGGGDTINGGSGNDELTGGGSADVFVFNRRSGDDEITDFANNTDKLDLSKFAVSSTSDMNNAGAIVANGAGSIIDLTQIGGDGVIYVEDMGLADWNNADFLFA